MLVFVRTTNGTLNQVSLYTLVRRKYNEVCRDHSFFLFSNYI